MALASPPYKSLARTVFPPSDSSPFGSLSTLCSSFLLIVLLFFSSTLPFQFWSVAPVDWIDRGLRSGIGGYPLRGDGVGGGAEEDGVGGEGNPLRRRPEEGCDRGGRCFREGGGLAAQLHVRPQCWHTPSPRPLPPTRRPPHHRQQSHIHVRTHCPHSPIDWT